MQRSTCMLTHERSGVSTLSQQETEGTGANSLVRFGITALLIVFVFMIVVLIFVIVILVVGLVPPNFAFPAP